ncbi:apolipoprotein D [Drosophila innubila]|uniref:apolipoprotein D n=1 Tax=Drosophila innubila TaxID=198719 RepID=UPI00148DAA6F|nr:apolipoprotein D [Drosophila innubila]
MPNLQIYFIASILLVAFVTQATTLAVFKGPCPNNMTSIGNFDMKRYLGKWYSHSMYALFSKKIPNCKSIEFIQEKDATYTLTNKEISTVTHTLKTKTYKINNIDSTIGKFDMEINEKGDTRSIEIYILDTDYDSFAIQFMCFDSNSVFNFQWAVINTRKRIPSAETIFTAQKMAQLSGIKISKMIKVLQHACPSDT